jgi:hypothetical protein
VEGTGNGGMCCMMLYLSFTLYLFSLSSVDTELLYVLITCGLATTC